MEETPEDNIGAEMKCGCDCSGQPIEWKNAIAIQRNAAAIAALVKTVQSLQRQIDELKPSA